MTRVYSSREVAEIVGADPSSVNRWIDSGKMKAYRTPGGHRRVLPEDLVAFLQDCGMPIPEQLHRDKPTRRVLLVDDDVSLLATIARSLKRLRPSLAVERCTSGIDALISIGANRPDVVVLDIFMPGCDGIAVCEKIKGDPELSATRVIAVTGRPSSRIARRVHEAGADQLLIKPVRPPDLLRAIEGDDLSEQLER